MTPRLAASFTPATPGIAASPASRRRLLAGGAVTPRLAASFTPATPGIAASPRRAGGACPPEAS
ncbi:hypothetical protein ACWEOZ_32270 [Actinoplanes sp. NPDC004185]